MSTKLKIIREAAANTIADRPVSDNPPNTTTINARQNRREAKKTVAVLSGKQKEPNRDQGADRRPSVPRAHRTGPVSEAFYTDQKSWEEDMKEHGATNFEKTKTRIIAKREDDILGAWSLEDKHGITGLGTNVQKLKETNMKKKLSVIVELSKKTLASYAKKASSSQHQNSNSNLASRAADKLAQSMDDGHPDDGEKEDHKSFKRSKFIGKAIDKIAEGWEDKLGGAIDKAKKAIEAGHPESEKLQHHWNKIVTGVNTGNSNPNEHADAIHKILKEDAPAMSAGGQGDPGHVQNATDNYSAQMDTSKKKKSVKSLMRRKAPK